MVYNLVRVSISGTAPGGEVWSVTPVFSAGELVPENPTPAQMTAAATAIAGITLGADLRSAFFSGQAITSVRLEARQLINGSLQAVTVYSPAAPIAGTGTAYKPLQNAIVFSLLTNTPGARGRGRLYWPYTGGAIDSATLRVSSTLHASLPGVMRTYLVAIATALTTNMGGPAFSLAVYSRTGGALHPVTSIRLGNVIDTQRRRRDALVEAFSTVSYPS